MSPIHQRLWSTGQWLVYIGLVGGLVVGVTASLNDLDPPPWLDQAANITGWTFVGGALILWAYALRFYFRVQKNLRVIQSATYLMVAICLNFLAPIIFMVFNTADQHESREVSNSREES